jgi:hypothetical protein
MLNLPLNQLDLSNIYSKALQSIYLKNKSPKILAIIFWDKIYHI